MFVIAFNLPFYVHATGGGEEDPILGEEVETDITIEEGDDLTLQSGVTSDSETNIEANNETTTNRPTNGTQSSDASLTNVRTLRRSASNILNSWRSSIRNTRRLSGSQLVQAIQNGNSLIVVGNLTFDMEEFEDGVLGPASMLWTMVNDQDNPISDRARENAQNGSGNASPSGARYPGWNNIAPDLQEEAVTSLMIEEGLTPS